MRLEKDQLADMFNVTVQTISAWQRDGLPIDVVGSGTKSNQYESKAVIDWYVQREMEQDKAGVSGADNKSLRAAEHQRLAIKGQQELMKLQEMQGRLVDRERVEQEFIEALRGAISQLYGGVAHMVAACMGAPTETEVRNTYIEILNHSVGEAVAPVNVVPPDIQELVEA